MAAPEEGDFSLTILSPCIDAANPDPEFNDPDSTRADMGALYFRHSGSAVDVVTWGRVKRLFR